MPTAWENAVAAKLGETFNILGERYGVAAGLVRDNAEIRDLFLLAVREKWAEDTTGTSQQKFMSKLRETNWWKTNTDEWRKLSILKYNDPAEFKLRFDRARMTFAAQAAKVGVQNVDPKTREILIAMGIQAGWSEDEFTEVLAQHIKRDGANALQGAAGALEQQLKDTSMRNGLRFSDQFYVDAAQSVLGRKKTAEDWQTWIREQAAAMYQPYADQIRSGMDLAEAASAVTNVVADQLELDPMQVQLTDPLVQKVLTNLDDAGKPAVLPLWKVRDMARQDDRFMRTSKAQKEVAGLGADVLKAWGVWK